MFGQVMVMLCPCGHYLTSVVCLVLQVCLVSLLLMTVVLVTFVYFLPCLIVVYILFPFCLLFVPFCLLFVPSLSDLCPLFVRSVSALCPTWVCLVSYCLIFVRMASKTCPSVCFKKRFMSFISSLFVFLSFFFFLFPCLSLINLKKCSLVFDLNCLKVNTRFFFNFYEKDGGYNT